jgi:hypothetical protein
MATVLEWCNTEEQRYVVRFYGQKDTVQMMFIKKMLPVYGGKSMLRKRVHNLVENFSQGCSKLADAARPFRPVEIATEATVQRVEELIRADRRITIDSVATVLGCSHGLAYSTMHDRLKFRKVCAQWVPRELKDRE